ncbi:MAG TPA: hypothetical protein VGD58_22715, partial [Herpetosiphonaceae bacterium]
IGRRYHHVGDVTDAEQVNSHTVGVGCVCAGVGHRSTMDIFKGIVRFYLNYISMKEKFPEIKQEFITLSDIYHAIGASRMALTLAYVFYLIYNIWIHAQWWINNSGRMILATLTVTFIAFVLLRVLERTRTRSFYSSQSILRHSFKWYASQIDESKQPGTTNGKATAYSQVGPGVRSNVKMPFE